MDITRIGSAVNCYLLRLDEGYALVDTGHAFMRRRLDVRLGSAGCRKGDLRLIVLTHADPDHAGNAAYLQRRYGVCVAVHPGEADAMRGGRMHASRSSMPDYRSPLFGLALQVMAFLARLRGTDTAFEPCEPDLLLDDGADLSAFGLAAEVLHLPGHSSGSIGVLTAEHDLFCGDLFVNVTSPSVHYLVDRRDEFTQSIARLAELGVRTVYPGHGRPFAFDLAHVRMRGLNRPAR